MLKKTNTEICETDKSLTRRTLKVSSGAYKSLTEGGFCEMAVSRTVRLRKYIREVNFHCMQCNC